MRVRVKQGKWGYYNDIRQRQGMIFVLKEIRLPATADHPKGKVISPEDQFSPKWMEKVTAHEHEIPEATEVVEQKPLSDMNKKKVAVVDERPNPLLQEVLRGNVQHVEGFIENSPVSVEDLQALDALERSGNGTNAIPRSTVIKAITAKIAELAGPETEGGEGEGGDNTPADDPAV